MPKHFYNAFDGFIFSRFSRAGFAPSPPAPASAPLSCPPFVVGLQLVAFWCDVTMLPFALVLRSHPRIGMSAALYMYTLFFLLHHARRPLLLLTPCRRSLEQKPSIYETRVVKKFFEQHDDPATTRGISDYVQEVNNMHTPHHNAEKAPRPPPALAPHEVRCGA